MQVVEGYTTHRVDVVGGLIVVGMGIVVGIVMIVIVMIGEVWLLLLLLLSYRGWLIQLRVVPRAVVMIVR